LRTPDARFAALPEFPWQPRYGEWRGLRFHYLEGGHFLPEWGGDVAREALARWR
jgi:hypothetical protein